MRYIHLRLTYLRDGCRKRCVTMTDGSVHHKLMT